MCPNELKIIRKHLFHACYSSQLAASVNNMSILFVKQLTSGAKAANTAPFSPFSGIHFFPFSFRHFRPPFLPTSVPPSDRTIVAPATARSRLPCRRPPEFPGSATARGIRTVRSRRVKMPPAAPFAPRPGDSGGFRRRFARFRRRFDSPAAVVLASGKRPRRQLLQSTRHTKQRSTKKDINLLSVMWEIDQTIYKVV